MQVLRPAPRASAAHSRWLLMLALTTASLPGLAEERSRADPPRTPLQWVEAIQRAAIRVNYSGTIVYQAGGEMRTSRITHLYDGARSQERVQTLDGKPREYLRLRTKSNDEVHCLIPLRRDASSSNIAHSTSRFPG